MRKTLILLAAVLLALGLCACSPAGSSSTYTVTRNGTEYVVNQENSTISDGMYTYQYTFSGNASSYDIGITYPDGSTYWWSWQANRNGIGFGSGGGSDDYDASRYVSGDVLCDILEAGAPAPKESNPGMILAAVLLMGIGLFNILSPQTVWYLSSGWKFKDAEPSELALGLGRLGGGAVVFIGVIVFLVGLLG